MSKSIVLILFCVFVSACKPGDYNYNVQVRDVAPEERARAAILQATAEAAQIANQYTRDKSYLELDAMQKQNEARYSAALAKIQDDSRTAAALAQAERQRVEVRGQAEARGMEATGQAAAVAVMSLGYTLAASLLIFVAFLAASLIIRSLTAYKRVTLMSSAWTLEGRNGLSDFVLIRDGSRLYLQDVLTGQRADVRNLTEINAVRRDLLLAQAPLERQDGLARRFWNALENRARRNTSNAIIQAEGEQR